MEYSPDPTAGLLPEKTGKICALWLFACFQLFYLLTASGRFHTVDEYEVYYATESLAERGKLSLPEGKAFFGRRARDGEMYPPYGPLVAVAALPWHQTGKIVGEFIDGTPRLRESLSWFFSSLSNTTLAAAAVAVFFLLALRLRAALLPALGAAFLLGIATPHWHYATTFFSQPLAALLLLLAAYSLAGCLSREPAGASFRSFLIAGLPLGLLAGARLSETIYFPVFGLAVLLLAGGGFLRRVLTAASYCAIPALAVGIYLLWNQARFGDPLQPGYPEAMEGGKDPRGFFDGSFLNGLYGLTLSPGKGLFIFAPLTLIGLIAGRWFLARTVRFGWALMALPLVPILFFAGYAFWEGGYCWGPRFLLPAIPFWILPLAFIPWSHPRWRWFLAATAAVSFLIQGLGVSVSFVECQVGRKYYLPDFVYNLDYSALLTTWKVFRHYVDEAMAGRLLVEPEGLGFDRWFFFLHKSGAPTSVLAASVAGLAGLLAAAVIHLVRTVRRIFRRPSPLPSACEVPEEDAVAAP